MLSQVVGRDTLKMQTSTGYFVAIIFMLFMLTMLEIRQLCAPSDSSFHGNRNISRPFENSKNWHEYALDRVPPDAILDPKLVIGGPIELCVVIIGIDTAKEAQFLLRSLAVHARRLDISFHFLVTTDVIQYLRERMDEFGRLFVNFKYEFINLDMEDLRKRVEFIRFQTQNSFDILRLSKAFAYIYFGHIDRCIILDTDIVFGTDPFFLWSYFSYLPPDKAGIQKLDDNDQLNMCSGVVLSNFSLMRQMDFQSIYRAIIPKVCQKVTSNKETTYACRLRDQTLFFGIQVYHDLFIDLPNSWTLDKCRHFRGHMFKSWNEPVNRYFGIVHFNCLPKFSYNDNSIDLYIKPLNMPKLTEYLKFLDHLPCSKLKFGNGKVKEVNFAGYQNNK